MTTERSFRPSAAPTDKKEELKKEYEGDGGRERNGGFWS